MFGNFRKRRKKTEAEETCKKKEIKRIKDLSRVDARESDDACRILRNFSEEKKFFQIFSAHQDFRRTRH